MTTTPPNFGDVPWTERDLGAPYDHERAAKEVLDAADRICSPANAGSIPFDINVITAAQVNATIGVGEAILAMLHELRSRSKEAKKGLALAKIKILEEVKEKPMTARRYRRPRHELCWLAVIEARRVWAASRSDLGG
jgi:hypothetical protein